MDDKFYIEKCLMLAYEKSPDPSTQNAAILVNDKGTIVAEAVNEFPKGVKYLPKRWERPLKYAFIEHAERNVIFDACKRGVKTNGLIMYCPFFACQDCSRAIVQAGIKRVVGMHHINDCTNDRWSSSCQIGDTILDEAGVERVYIDEGVIFNLNILRDGKIITV